MSYSTCFACSKMVFSYEKYCNSCAQIYRQDSKYWRNPTYAQGKEKEAGLLKDAMEHVGCSTRVIDEVTNFTTDQCQYLTKKAFEKSGRKTSRRRH